MLLSPAGPPGGRLEITCGMCACVTRFSLERMDVMSYAKIILVQYLMTSSFFQLFSVFIKRTMSK